jgi:hypothetical protein
LELPNGELKKLPIRSIYPIIPMGKMRTEQALREGEGVVSPGKSKKNRKREGNGWEK